MIDTESIAFARKNVGICGFLGWLAASGLEWSMRSDIDIIGVFDIMDSATHFAPNLVE